LTGIQDDRIATLLAPLRAATVSSPFPGDWLSPPYAGTSDAVVADDPGIARLLVDRTLGTVTYENADDRQLVNNSVDQFVECAHAYTDALRTAGRIDQGEDDADDELERLERALRRRLAAIDPATRQPESFWATGAEEIGSGLLAESPDPAPPPTPSRRPVGRPGVLVALTDEERERFFPRADWLRLADIADVRVVSAPQRLAMTVEAFPVLDGQRGRTTPAWRVLLTGAGTEDLGARRAQLLPADCAVIDVADATPGDVFGALDRPGG
jgi:hypothetical protein